MGKIVYIMQGIIQKVNFMNYDTIKEELDIDSDINKINRNFRKYLNQVFSNTFLKKIDRVFKKPLVIENFKEKSNVMALTVGTNISLNIKMFKDLNVERGMVYIVHELFHVLQNLNQFPEVKTVNRMLGDKTMARIPEQNINEFLTGKPQNIHSDYKDEFLSYCSNAAFNWKLCPTLKTEYYNILNNSGLFNMKSDFWKKRFK